MPQDNSKEALTIVSRRAALKLAAVAVVGVSFGASGVLNRVATHWGRTPLRPYQFFAEAEAKLLIAICEQIIPRDDTPGATDAGVIFYIDRQLSGPLARHQQKYRLGLDAVRKTCVQVYQLSFEELAFEQQTDALRQIEAGRVPPEHWGDLSPQAFFGLVLDHTRQGFYGSPRHGGNRDYVSYRMLGLAYPNLIGQNRYAAGQSI